MARQNALGQSEAIRKCYRIRTDPFRFWNSIYKCIPWALNSILFGAPPRPETTSELAAFQTSDPEDPNESLRASYNYSHVAA